MNSFICDNCHKTVTTIGNIGTHQRNHCPFCLYSKHVDNEKGDRKADCGGFMESIGVTFKKEGKGRIGEIMMVHQCQKCGKISINRIAADDKSDEIVEVFEKSLEADRKFKNTLKEQGITLLEGKDKKELEIQLFGN